MTFEHRYPGRILLSVLLSAVGLAAAAQGSADRVVDLHETALLELVHPGQARLSPGQAASLQRQSFLLPSPDGTQAAYVLEPAAAMAPELQARYPELLSFVGFRQNLPHQRLRATYSPDAGWTLAYSGHESARAVVYAETAPVSRDRRYRMQYATDLTPALLACGVTETRSSAKVETGGGATAPGFGSAAEADLSGITEQAPQNLRRYRLALTCTGEYARAVAGDNPTKAAVLAAVLTAVNRLNEVYERDLGITFELVADNDRLIFLDPATDPYDNTSADALTEASHTQITKLIGTGAFDIGHVFATAGAGLATLASVCDPRTKGQGSTGISNPANDYFYIDYFAHEIGHQLGAAHTFYNSCNGNRSSSTAFEPGSGSTIMSYAGICSPNVQNRVDDYFHAASLAQVSTTVASTGACAQTVTTDNQAPEYLEASAPASVYFVPASTPFLLEAAAADADGDALTYTWEQMDKLGTAPQPPVGASEDGPLFRSLPPSPSPRRVFATIPGQYATLPSVARELSFRGTVRDNRRPAGATAHKDVRLQVVEGAAAFEVLNFASNTNADGFSTQEIVYRAGNTRRAPINAELVDIFLSPDAGQTYSDTLAIGLPNTGAAYVTLPNVNRSGRIVVRGHGNVFFALSKGTVNLTASSTPQLILTTDTRQRQVCVGVSTFGDTLRGRGVLGFGESVRLKRTELPPGVSVVFDTLPRAPGFAVAYRIDVGAAAPPGQYRIGFWGVGASSAKRFGYAELVLTIAAPPNALPEVMAPEDGSVLNSTQVEFVAAVVGDAPRVRLQISRDPRFGIAVADTNLTLGATTVRRLAPGIYYWRAAAINDCGAGPWTEGKGFQVLDLVDTTLVNLAAVPISAGAAGDYKASIAVLTTKPIYRYEVSTGIRHLWVGDLSASLRLPDGAVRQLFGQPGGGDCGGSDLEVTLADDAVASVREFTNTCATTVPSIVGRFRALDALSAGLPAALPGRWTLTVRDNAPDDGGTLDKFSLRYWVRRGAASAAVVVTDTFFVRTAERTILNAAKLRVEKPGVPARDVVYVLRTTPQAGNLYRGAVTLNAMDTFSQASLSAELISYQSLSPSAAEVLVLDILVGQGEYFPNRRLPVTIGTKTQPLSLWATATVLPGCAGDASGEVTLAANGGVTPYRYGEVGGAVQDDPQLTGLTPGDYEFLVLDAHDGVQRIKITLGSGTPFVAEVAGSRVRITRDGTVPLQGVSYSFDGGRTFASDSVGYAFASGTVDVRVRAGACTYVLSPAVTRPLRLEVRDFAICPTDQTAVGGEVCISGGVGRYEVVPGPGLTAAAGFPRAGCDSVVSVRRTTFGSTSYSIGLRDAVGAVQTATLQVVEPQQPTLSLTSADRVVTVGIRGGTGPYAFRIDGSAFQRDSTFTGIGDGPHDVEVQDGYGCVYGYAQVSEVNASVAGLGLGWRVYPNPARDYLMIEVDDATDVQQITLRTVTGQTVLTIAGTDLGSGLGAKTQIDVAHLAAGYYVLELRTDASVSTVPVVVE